MTGAGHAQERRARDPRRKRASQGDRYQAIGFSPQHQCGCSDVVESAREPIESELTQHGTQRAPVLGLRDRRVVLVYVRIADLARVAVGGLEQPLGEPPAPEREQQRSNEGPTPHAEQWRLAGAEPGRADEYQAAHPLGVRDGDFCGDGPADRMPDEHGVRQMEGVEQGHGETGVGGAVVAGGGFVREAEAAVVEGDHPVACGRDGCEVLAPGVHRGPEPVEEDDGGPSPLVDVTQCRAVDRDVPGGESGPRGKPAGLGDGGGPARRDGEKAAPREPLHGRLRSATRTTASIAGCELQRAATPSPTPLATTACASSISRIVGVSGGTPPATRLLASTGTSPATRSSTVVRSRARRQAGSDGRNSSAASTPSTRCPARATSCMTRLAAARAPATARLSGSTGSPASRSAWLKRSSA